MRPELVWWTFERIRGRCEEGGCLIFNNNRGAFHGLRELSGMCHESLNKTSAALQAYDAGLRLIESLDLLAVVAKDEKTSSAAFKEYRELWRWVERLLRRRCVIASRRLCATPSVLRIAIFTNF